MRTLKTNGVAEVDRLLRRVRRALAMERIFPADAKALEDHLQFVRARIISMRELNESGEEEG